MLESAQRARGIQSEGAIDFNTTHTHTQETVLQRGETYQRQPPHAPHFSEKNKMPSEQIPTSVSTTATSTQTEEPVPVTNGTAGRKMFDSIEDSVAAFGG